MSITTAMVVILQKQFLKILACRRNLSRSLSYNHPSIIRRARIPALRWAKPENVGVISLAGRRWRARARLPITTRRKSVYASVPTTKETIPNLRSQDRQVLRTTVERQSNAQAGLYLA